MKRSLGFLIIIGLLLALSLPTTVAAQDTSTPEPVGLRPDAPTYALHGPYWVGTRAYMIDEGGEAEIPIRVWYPALNPDAQPEAVTYLVRSDSAFRQYTDPERELPIEGQALLNAAPDSAAAPYPLVVLSPSYTCWMECQYFLAEHLASYGFVVISLEHKGDTWAVLIAPTIHRIAEVTATIAYAETLTAADGDLAGVIDTDTIAVGGWSSGGSITYGAANAAVAWDGVEEYCATIPEAMPCANMEGERAAALAELGLETAPEGDWATIGDRRVDAIFPMAGGGEVNGQSNLAELTIPMLALFGSVDSEAPWCNLAYEQVASAQKAKVVFNGANHFIFGSDGARVPWAAEVGAYEWASDAVWDMSRAHDLINHFTTAFLLDVLKGDTDAAAALAPDTVSFPGIDYQAQGF